MFKQVPFTLQSWFPLLHSSTSVGSERETDKFEWAAFRFNKVVHRFGGKKWKFYVDDALWPLRNELNNDGREKQKKRYSKGKFKPTTAEQNIDEKNGLNYCRASNDNNRTS